MKRSLTLGLLVVSGLLGAASVGFAQSAGTASPAQLVGTWKGVAKAVNLGASPYRVMKDPSAPYYSNEPLDVTFTVTDQQDERFSGTLSIANATETLIGSLMPPSFAQGIVLDDDGVYMISLRDAATIDLCYAHLYPKSKVVACFTMIKQ